MSDTTKRLVASLARAGLAKLAAVAPPPVADKTDLENQHQKVPRQQSFQERSEVDRRRLAIIGTGHETLIPTNDKLLAYQTLTGFDTAPVLLSEGHAGRAAPNIGLHARVVSAEREADRRYRRYHLLINFCLGAQIVVGAALTALGAAKGSRKAITAFAAMNTIMAAILTYLKGSDLPDRYRAQGHGWRQIREHMEQREREFGIRDCSLNVEEEVAVIEDMYNRMRSEAANNSLRGGPHQRQCPCGGTGSQSQSQQPTTGQRRFSSWQGESIARPSRVLQPRGRGIYHSKDTAGEKEESEREAGDEERQGGLENAAGEEEEEAEEEKGKEAGASGGPGSWRAGR